MVAGWTYLTEVAKHLEIQADTNSISVGVAGVKYKHNLNTAGRTVPRSAQRDVGLDPANSLVDYLKSRGEPSDFETRKVEAKKLGIKGVPGSFGWGVDLDKAMRSRR